MAATPLNLIFYNSAWYQIRKELNTPVNAKSDRKEKDEKNLVSL